MMSNDKMMYSELTIVRNNFWLPKEWQCVNMKKYYVNIIVGHAKK